MTDTLAYTSLLFIGILAAINAFITILLLRAHGRQLLGSALSRDEQGPAVGNRHPRSGLLDHSQQARQPRLVVFVSSGCSPCETLLSHMSSAFELDQKRLCETIISVQGRAHDVDKIREAFPATVRVVHDKNDEASLAWRVFSTPFAVVVGREGRVLAKTGKPNSRWLEEAVALDSELSRAGI